MEQIKKGDKLYYNNIKTQETIVEVLDISKDINIVWKLVKKWWWSTWVPTEVVVKKVYLKSLSKTSWFMTCVDYNTASKWEKVVQK